MAAAVRLLIRVRPSLCWRFCNHYGCARSVHQRSRYASILRWLTLSLFAYVATVFAVGVPWLTVGRNLVCLISNSPEAISPSWSPFSARRSAPIFFGRPRKKSRTKKNPKAKPLVKAPDRRRANCAYPTRHARGHGFSYHCRSHHDAATLNLWHKGHSTRCRSGRASRADCWGELYFVVFVLGIVGTGMLLALVGGAGALGDALGEALAWRVGRSS